MIVAPEARGAAFGWLAMGVQIGTAASPLLTGALAAATLPRRLPPRRGAVLAGRPHPALRRARPPAAARKAGGLAGAGAAGGWSERKISSPAEAPDSTGPRARRDRRLADRIGLEGLASQEVVGRFRREQVDLELELIAVGIAIVQRQGRPVTDGPVRAGCASAFNPL
jgi:MFS family permease